MKAIPGWLRAWALAFLVPRPLVGIGYLPRYFSHWFRYRALGVPLRWADSYPSLGDWTTHTPFDAHYFYQGGWLARRIHAERPENHVDVGSSVMMVSMLSAMVDTVFIDVRPLEANLAGLESRAGDILALPFATDSVASISCQHVIEHIGLGRYGDPLDADGSRKAAFELARVAQPGGRLYVSLPVGRERVCFNAHRVHSPTGVPSMFPGLELLAFSYVDDNGRFYDDARPEAAAGLDYGCGMYMFTKPR